MADVGQFSDENGDFSLQIDCFNTDPYEKKYFALLRRCESTQQSNERLVNRIHHVQRMLRRLRHERRLLMKRLDQHGDDYLSVPLTFPAEEDFHSIDMYSSSLSPTTAVASLPLPSESTSSACANEPNASGPPAKKKARSEKETRKSSSNPYFLFSSSPIMEIKQEMKDDFSHEDLSKTFGENWANMGLPDEKKQLFFNQMNIKQEIE